MNGYRKGKRCGICKQTGRALYATKEQVERQAEQVSAHQVFFAITYRSPVGYLNRKFE